MMRISTPALPILNCRRVVPLQCQLLLSTMAHSRAALKELAELAGFWGPVDALHKFCEPAYSSTEYVAELYNSLGSLCTYVVAALCGLHATRGMGWQVRCGWWSLLLVGIGSSAFHATMRYHTELLDEIPMLLLMSCSLIAKESAHPKARSPRAAMLLILGVSAGFGALVTAYLVTRIFGLFVTGFTGMVLADIYAGATSQTQATGSFGCFKRATAAIVVARIFWELENHTCAFAPWVWPFHNVWHCLSCIAAYYQLGFCYYYRLERLGARGVYGYQHGVECKGIDGVPSLVFCPRAWRDEIVAQWKSKKG